jgi:hypothetical protein
VGILILNLRRRYVYLFILSLHFKGSIVTEHGVTEQWSYTGSDPDLCTLSGLAAHYFSLLQQAWRLLWVDQGSSPRLRKTAQN